MRSVLRAASAALLFAGQTSATPASQATGRPAASAPTDAEERSLEALRQLFPQGKRPPAALERLLLYQLRHGEGFSEDFAVDPAASVAAWFGHDPTAAQRLAPFATKSDGSVFAFWLAGAAPVERAPVVLLDAEGRNNTVLANTFEDFLSLLALGSSLPAAAPSDPEAAPDVDSFRLWLRNQLSVTAARSPLAIMERARAANPGLTAWLGQARLRGAR
jgi:hypothetical protein